MGIDKLTHRALPWYPAAALQHLGREQPFPTHFALLRNTTATLNRQYHLDGILDLMGKDLQRLKTFNQDSSKSKEPCNASIHAC